MSRRPPRLRHTSGRAATLGWLCLAACVAGGGSTMEATAGGEEAAPLAQLAAQLAPNHIPPVSPCVDGRPAPRSLRRLTRAEYNASVRDLLGGDGGVPEADALFGGDPAAYGFANIQYNLVVTRNTIGDVQAQAEAVAAFALDHPTLVSSACADATDACSRRVVADFGRRAYRRPLTAAEVDAHVALLAGLDDFATRAQVLVAAMLQSPHFLYRAELGEPVGDRFVLTQHEVAAELSYLVVGSIPDAALMRAADQGGLAQGGQILAHGRRLLADPRARPTVVGFFLAWLQVADLEGQVRAESDGRSLSQAEKRSMQRETARFVEDLVFDANGTFHDLLTAPHTFLDGTLSQLYGVGGASGDDFVRVPWQRGERLGGVLGQGGVLAAASQATFASPTLRGRALRMRVLCQPLAAPPANVSQLEAGTATRTLRETFAAHGKNPACAGCHQLMDPLAFPLGNFDALGRRRPGDLENGVAVDLSGMVFSPTVGAATALADGEALTRYLADSPQAALCLTRHMAFFGLGQLTFAQDGCTFDGAARFVAGEPGATLATMFLALTQTDSFVRRAQDP